MKEGSSSSSFPLYVAAHHFFGGKSIDFISKGGTREYNDIVEVLQRRKGRQESERRRERERERECNRTNIGDGDG